MKKVMLMIVAFAGIAFGASFEESIKSLIEKDTETKIKIVDSQDFKDTKGLKLVVVEIGGSLQQIPLIATKDGKMVFALTNVFFTSSKADNALVAKIAKEVDKNNSDRQTRAAGELIEKLSPSQYISLKSSDKNSKKTYFIVADPNCGYCREEIKTIDRKLKTHNINMVMVGILGEDSLKRSAYAMNKITESMSDKEKIKILKEVYSASFKAPKSIDTSAIKKTSEFLFSTGVIRGVPYIYEK